MRDLSELVNGVRNQVSRDQFREAVSAYNAGAFRSSIVATWIAVVVDLTDKARDFADGGDSTAQQQIRELDRAIAANNVPAVQRFESDLLKIARENHEFITHREYDELQRLYQDRNLCAHPAFVDSNRLFQPSAEQVRAHLATAVDAVLSQAPVPGKVTVGRFQDEIRADSWPDPLPRAHIEERFMAGAKPTIQRQIAQIVVKGCIEPPEGDWKIAKRCHVVAKALDATRPGLLAETIENVIKKRDVGVGFEDKHLLHVVGGLGCFPVTWNTMPQSLITRTKHLLDAASEKSLADERTFYGGPPAQKELKKVYEERVHELNAASLHSAAGRLPHPQFVIPAIARLREALNFRSAEDRFSTLLLLSDYFEKDHVELLRHAIMSNSQVRNAHRIPDELYNLYTQVDPYVAADAIWKGLATDLRDSVDDPDDHYAYPKFCTAVLDR